MRNILTLGLLALVLAPGAYGVAQARDPRVPRLQEQVRALSIRVRIIESTKPNSTEVRALESRIGAVEASLARLDRICRNTGRVITDIRTDFAGNLSWTWVNC
jgi:hypothetical protein